VVKKQTQQTKQTLSRAQHIHRKMRLAVVPHRSNQYRPFAIRRYSLVAVIIAVFGVYFLNNTMVTGDVLGQQAMITPQTLLVATNTVREQEGLNDLALNQKLSQAAYSKAQDMLSKQYWSHESPAGVQPWKWMSDVQYNYSHAGENLAKGFTTSDGVTSAWLASPEHRANVLGSLYQDVGFAAVEGVLDGKDITLVVAMYGTPVQETAVAGIATTTFTAPTEQTGILAVIGQKVQSLPAAAIGSILLVGLLGGVAMAAHASRKRLPKAIRSTWRHHHAAVKVMGLGSLSVIIVIMYSGGQI